MDVSIVIPTHKRAKILRQTLAHIQKQTTAGSLEVIVVSDGPDKETADMIQHYSWSFPIQYFSIPKAQQGIARNEGVKKVKGEFVLFIGDDIFLQPNVCDVHLTTHQRLKAESYKLSAVLGFTTWDPAVGVTPVMKWLEKTGWQFGYEKIKKYAHTFIPESIQHRFTYASHLSLPAEAARRVSFHEDVSLYGWEDIEWGLRLHQAGVRLLYEPDAKALHHHRIDLDESLTRMKTIGRSLDHVTHISPRFDRIPQGIKWNAYRLISLFPTIRGKHYKALMKGIGNRE